MGKPPTLYSFAKPEDLTRSLRSYVLAQQAAALERHGIFRVAVSGGSLPKQLAGALLDDTEGEVKWGKWEIYFADERAVPLDHEDSNYKLLKDEILDKLPSAGGEAEGGTQGGNGAPKVFPIDTAHLDDVQELADSYEKTLVSQFAARDSVKLPTFDLILLGMGPDGHTCSLFPGHALLRETDGAWVQGLNDSPKPPPSRVTLSLTVVVHASKIAFVATGGGKKDVLRKILEEEDGRELPCGMVNELAGDKVSWFTDAAATEGISFPHRSTL